MTQRRPHYDFILAWAEGAEIECLIKGTETWEKVKNPSFSPDITYRIALIPDTINWDHVNEKYNYLARDRDGECFLFENKPTIAYNSNVWNYQEGGCIQANLFTSLSVGTVDWKDSLQVRPGYEDL